MAKADLIVKAMVLAEEEASRMEVLMEAFSEIAGDKNVPSWFVVVWDRSHALEAAVRALGEVVRRDALPYLADLDRASNGGMGGMPPMVTKVMAGQSAPSRT